MKGPALWLKHYLRCRLILSNAQWIILLYLGAKQGLWVRRFELVGIPGSGGGSTNVQGDLERLQSGGLVDLRRSHGRQGAPSWEARITDKGMAFLGWPELVVAGSGGIED
ncbi:MAG: hypothetical protein U0984_07530 [Prosthecobacter sp.]|nr:hypothetical protein [Prosthecobacter sp.]